MKKKLLSYLLTLTMVLSMASFAPLVASAAVTANYTLFLCEDGTLRENNAAGTTITDAMASEGATVTDCTFGALVLKLDGFVFETTAATALEVPSGTTIVLVGNNTIESTYHGSSHTIGIESKGNLEISSSTGGKVNIKSGTAGTSSANYGIFAVGDVTISGDAEAVVTSGTTPNYLSYGIYASDGYNGKVTICDNAFLTAIGGGTGNESYGIYAVDIEINDGAGVIAKGGTAPNSSVGIYYVISSGNLTINGGTLTATGHTRAINGDYTVPNGYEYWTNTNADGISGTADNDISDGYFVIDATHQYAKIEAVTATPQSITAATYSAVPYSVGNAITATAGTYTANDGGAEGTHTYKWYRADTGAGAGAAAIGSANALTYTPVAADFGKWICIETTPVGAAGLSGTPVASAYIQIGVKITASAAGAGGASAITVNGTAGAAGKVFYDRAPINIIVTKNTAADTVAWTAGSGTFADSTAATTTYTPPASPAGNIALTAALTAPSTDAAITAIAGQAIAWGGGDGSDDTDKVKTASINVANNVSAITASNITRSANSTAAVTGGTLSVGSNTVKIEITAQDGTTKLYYEVTVTRAAASLGGGGLGGGGGGGAAPSASLSQSKADYDTNSGKDLIATLNLNGFKIKSIKNGNYTLKEGTDYTVSGDKVTIMESYLAGLSTGAQTLTFEMDGGNNPKLTITVKDVGEVPSKPEPMKPTLPAGTQVGATKTNNPLLLNGEEVDFPAVKIDGWNWLKLRDVAMLLDGASKQFSIDYDKATNTITITTGQGYSPLGDELLDILKENPKAVASPQKVIFNGQAMEIAAYNVDGYNYFRLRDLMILLDIAVIYDEATGEITLDLNNPYTE